MSLNTHSKFYFNFLVTDLTLYVDFKEGAGPELTAELEIGEYTMTDFAVELERALNEAGALTFTVSVNRSTRIFTIGATGAFTILGLTGLHTGTSALPTAGFALVDTGSATSHAGGSAAGSSYVTQFILQSYVSTDDLQDAVSGVVSYSASGKPEVVRFGTVRFAEMNFRFVNDRNNGSGGPLRYNATGVANLRTFMQYLVTKAPFEFMKNESSEATFESMILEKTPDDSKGLKYKLKEMNAQNLPGYFETGVLTMRAID